MESELLGAEDYASVHQAMQQLSRGSLNPLTLNARMEAWAQLVTEVEEGFDTVRAFEFGHELTHRDWLHEAWPILTERVRRLRQPELDALDGRFRAATAPIRPLSMSLSEMAGQTRWWRFRYPKLVTGDPTEPLPATWSPPPTHIW